MLGPLSLISISLVYIARPLQVSSLNCDYLSGTPSGFEVSDFKTRKHAKASSVANKQVEAKVAIAAPVAP